MTDTPQAKGDETVGGTGPDPGPPPPEHHLADEIRQEIHEIEEKIEEIVEHVPPPVRWTVRKLVLLGVLGVVGLFVIAVITAVLYVANRTEWAAQELTLVVNRTLAARSDLRLELKDIKGNLITGVRLIEPRLRMTDGRGAPLLAAHEIRLSYSPARLVGAGNGPIQVTIDRPTVRVERGPDGKLRLPRWESRPHGKSTGTTEWEIHLRDGSAWIGDERYRFAGVSADVGAEVGPTTRVDVHSLRWAQGPYHSALKDFSAQAEVGDSLKVVLRDLVSGDGRLKGDATFARETGRGGRFNLEFTDVRFAWLSEVFDNHTLAVPGTASGRVSGRYDGSWTAQISTRANWDSLPIDAQGTLHAAQGRITIDPLAGVSPAGELNGTLHYQRTGWTLEARVHRGDPARWGFLGLEGWPAGRLDGRFVYDAVAHNRAPNRLSAWLGSSMLAGWNVDTAKVDVIMFPTAPDSFAVRAYRRGGEFDLFGRSMTGGWEGRFAIAGFPLDEWPDGRRLGLSGVLGRGEGSVRGVEGHLMVDGALEGRTLQWAAIRSTKWTMPELRGQMLPVTDLVGRAQLGDALFNGVHLDSILGPFHLYGDSLAVGECRAIAADTLIRADGRATWGEHGWSYSTQHLMATSHQFQWVNEGEVRLEGDEDGVVFRRFVLRDGPARAELSGRWASPSGQHDWLGRVTNLDLARVGMPDSLAASGLVDADLHVSGPGDAPTWRLDGIARAVGFQGHRADSVAARVSGGPGGAGIDEGHLWLGAGRLTLHGRVRDTREVWPAALTPQPIWQWLAYGARWEGSLHAEDFPLERVAALQPLAAGVRGRLSGDLTWSGSPTWPHFDLKARVGNPAWQNVELDQIEVGAIYEGGRLDIGRVVLNRGATRSTIDGSMPLKIDLVAGRASIPDEAMNLHFDLPAGDLAVLPLFVPQVGYAAGTFVLDARVGGRASHPDVTGWGRVRGGTLRLATREEILKNLYADFSLRDSHLTLDSLAAREGDLGRVSGHGWVNLDGPRLKNYRFDLALRQFTALETGIYAAEVDGDIAVQDGPRRAGVVYPRATGRVSVRRAVVLYDFTNQSEAERVAATTRPLYWVYSLQVEARSGLHWRPPDADMEFSADLSVEQTLDSLLVFGELRSLRGNYYFLNNQFKVSDALLSFDNVGGLDPQLEVTATTRVTRAALLTCGAPSTGATTATDESGSEDITASITGRSSNASMTFSTTAGDFDEPCILRALTYAQFGNPETRGMLVENYLTRMLSRELSNQLSEAFGHYVGDWELNREETGQFTVGVGTQVTRELSLRYRQALPGYTPSAATTAGTDLFERDVAAEYRLSRFVYLTTGLAQRRSSVAGAQATGTTTDFNLNVKVRYEY